MVRPSIVHNIPIFEVFGKENNFYPCLQFKEVFLGLKVMENLCLH